MVRGASCVWPPLGVESERAALQQRVDSLEEEKERRLQEDLARVRRLDDQKQECFQKQARETRE